MTPIDQSPDSLAGESGDLFEQIAAHCLSGILVLRSDQVLYVNPAAAKMHGLTAEQMLQSNVLERVHELDYDRINGYLKSRLAGESPPNVYEYRMKRVDGTVGWVQSRVCIVQWRGEPAVCISQIDITAERQIFENLERDRRLFSEVIEQSPDGMCIADASEPGLPVIFANNAFYEMSGYGEQDVLGQSCNILQGPLSSPETIKQIRQCLDSGKKFAGEILNYRKSGETFWNRLSISPVFNANGELSYFVSSQVDITEVKESGERIKFLQLALDQLTERVSIFDNDDRYLYINHAIEKLIDQTDEQVRGKHISNVVSKDLYEAKLRDYLRESRSGMSATAFFDQDALLDVGHSPDGPGQGVDKRYVEYSTSSIKDANGQVTALVVVSRDKSDEVNTQMALTSSEKRFRDFVDIAADWYWESDVQGKFTFVSPTMECFLNSLSNPPATSLIKLWGLAKGVGNIPRLDMLARSIQSFSQESRFHLDDEDVYMRMEGRPMIVEDGSVEGFRGIARNLSVQRQMETDLRVLATQDELTGLLNRREFQSRFNSTVGDGVSQGQPLCLMYIDVDRLKFINDSFGHAAGDELIRRVAEVLREQTREFDCHIARIGGDEFVILFQQATTLQVQQLGIGMVEAVDNFYLFETKTDFRPGLSIGVVLIDAECGNLEVALAKADLACYRIKQGGGRNVAIYGEDDSEYEQRMQSNQLQLEIRRALDDDGFEIYLQPIVEIADNQSSIHAFELLLRMRDSTGTLVKPYDFIRAAESYGYIAEIDRWVVSNAIQLLVAQSCGEPIKLSINLSGSTLAEPDLARYIMREIETNEIDASCLTFEITETAAIAQVDHVITLIDTLTDIGCSFVLDDFGSGLSSYKYIQDFNIAGIKIDGSFIEGIAQKKANPMIVSSMVTLASNLELSVVAEWVEDEQTLLQLIGLGVTRFQGYYFAMPEPAETVLQSIRNIPSSNVSGIPLSHDTRVLKSTA